MAEHPLITLLCVALACATALGALWIRRAQPPAAADLAAERAAMKRDFAEALEQAASIGETIQKARARIDGARRREPELAPPRPRALADLTADEVAKLPVPEQLAWAAARRLRRGA